MKIGELSKLCGVSQATIRYYISLGLLIPEKAGYQFDFTEEDAANLEAIIKYKNFGFSLEDIHRIISINRYSYGKEPEDLREYVDLLSFQKAELQNKKFSISQQISELEKELDRIHQQAHIVRSKIGVPMEALRLICCPHCKTPFALKVISMDYNYFYEADLDCKTCGYHAYIHDGILYSDNSKGTSVYDKPDQKRLLYRESPNTLLSMVQKSWNWITNKLIPLTENGGRIVMETHLNAFFFLYRNIVKLSKNNLYIVSDKFKEIINLYKSNFESLGLDFKVLYIVSPDNDFPLCTNSIDVLIDYGSSNEHGIYSDSFYLDDLLPFLKQDASVFSTYFSFSPGSRSLKVLNQSYPENNPDNYQLSKYLSFLKQNYSIKEENNFGFLTDSGEGIVFIFHQTGEKLFINSYLLQKKA